MHFKTGNEYLNEYRIGFRYSMEPVTRSQTVRKGDITMTLTQVWDKHTATAVLFLKAPGGPKQAPEKPWHWEWVAQAYAVCSPKDNHNRIRGREIALGRLAKSQSPEMARLIWDAYYNRFEEQHTTETGA
jgi:hypothetical protein